MSQREAPVIDAEIRARLAEDGVVHLPAALSRHTVERARQALQWSLENPGPGAAHLPSKGEGTFYQDLANPAALTRYAPLVRDTEIADIVASLWGSERVWFMYEQVFAKTGGTTRRTPWHQDTPYLPVQGRQVVVLWMSFEPVAVAHALEFVRGSHRGTLYDGSRFDPDDDTAPLYGDGSLPRLPDIEADRSRWPIAAWATEPGDVIAFHPAILHGGGSTTTSTSRHTLSLRFFGDDATVAARPGRAAVEGAPPPDDRPPDPAQHPLTRMRLLPEGTPFRDAAFPELRPRP